MKRALLVTAALAAAPLVVAPGPSALAAPGGDATVVVTTVTLGSSLASTSVTVLCPAGSRALGGGAAPTAPAGGGASNDTRIYYSAPVESSGDWLTYHFAGVPVGWKVYFGQVVSATNQQWKVFVTCSPTVDATLVLSTGSSGASVKVPCPTGSRAVGGGVAPTTAVPDNTVPGQIQRSAPYAGAGPSATFDGNVPAGWETDAGPLSYGMVAVAVCATNSDATLRLAQVSVPAGTTTAGGTAATCPTGKRAVSGGLTALGTNQQIDNHTDFSAPVGDVTELAGIATGAVPRSWFADGKGDEIVPQATTYQVLAVCITDQPDPRDTTPPNTAKGNGPKKKTSSAKAKFTFSSEAGAAFTCQLDKKPAVACTSPYKVKKLKPGKHKLAVTATDAAGNADPSPAVFKWKVLKKKSKGHQR